MLLLMESWVLCGIISIFPRIQSTLKPFGILSFMCYLLSPGKDPQLERTKLWYLGHMGKRLEGMGTRREHGRPP